MGFRCRPLHVLDVGLYDRYLALRIRTADPDPPATVALAITERDLLEPGAYETLEDFLGWAFAYGAERVAVYVSVLDPEAIEPLERGLAAVDAPAPVAIHHPESATVAAGGAASDRAVDTSADGAPAGPEGSPVSTARAGAVETTAGHGAAEMAAGHDGAETTADHSAAETTDGPVDAESSSGEPTGGDGGGDDSATAESDGDPPIRIVLGLGGKHEFTEAVKALATEAAAGDLDPADLDEADVEAELAVPAEPDLVIKTGAERLSDFMIWQSVYSELYFTDVNWRDLRKRDYLRAIREYIHRNRRFGK